MTRASDAGVEASAQGTAPAALSRFDPAVLGVFFSAVSACGYTGANMALRSVAVPHDPDWAIWVSCIKAVPTAIVAVVLVGWRLWGGLPLQLSRRMFGMLLAAALFMQFAGNGAFQFALGAGGLAIVVPLSFAILIGSGAWLGRLYLGEPITFRTALAMSVLTLSILLLSAGTGDAAANMSAGASRWIIAAIVLAAGLSGLGYGAGGVAIRGALTRGVPLAVVLLIMSVTGVVALGLTSLVRMGPERLAATPLDDLAMMCLGGVTNAVAFFALGAAFKYISVVHVNLVNASQIAMSAAAGVLVFAEPLTGWIVGGCLLTIVGLLLMDTGRRDPPGPMAGSEARRDDEDEARTASYSKQE